MFKKINLSAHAFRSLTFIKQSAKIAGIFPCFFAFLCLIAFFASSALAQIRVVKRLEIPTDNKKGKEFQTLDLQEDGLLILLESGEYKKGGMKELIFWKLDTAFNNLWSESYATDYETEILANVCRKPFQYFLLKTDDKYKILKINYKEKSFTSIPYQEILNADINGFEAVGEKIILSGLSDGRPFVMHFDPSENKQTPLKSLPQEKVQLSAMQAEEQSKNIFVAVVGKQGQKKDAFFYRYDSLGNHMQTVSVPNNVDYSLMTFRFFSSSEEAFVVVGTYSQRNATRPQGIFSLSFEGENLVSERFYDFGYLKNYYSYLSEKARRKTEEKIKKAETKDDFIRHTLDFTVGEIMKNGKENILTLEGYIPVFNQNNNSLLDNPALALSMLRYNNYGRFLLRQNRFSDYGSRIPASFRYKNALILSFDNKGKLLWDNAFEYDNSESPAPPSPLAVNVSKDSIFMTDFFEDNFYIKTSAKNSNQSKPQKIEPPKNYHETEVLLSENGKVFRHYGHFFLYETQQTVRAGSEKKKKKVFALMKIYIEGYPKTPEK